MVVLPCTMGSLGAIANGNARNLIHRAADVILKEKKPLLLAVRETPLNRIHLENLLKVHDAGATVCPPMPAFYHHPKSLEEMATFFAGRLADLIGIEVAGLKRWQGLEKPGGM
jgi:4-hydroxy-3-polyprenylbenzoate decarboxylase